MQSLTCALGVAAAFLQKVLVDLTTDDTECLELRELFCTNLLRSADVAIFVSVKLHSPAATVRAARAFGSGSEWQQVLKTHSPTQGDSIID